MNQGERLKILLVVPYVPSHIRPRPLHFLRNLLLLGHEVVVATVVCSEQDQTDVERLREAGVQIVSVPLSLGRRLWNCLRALPSGLPLQAAYSWEPRLAEQLRNQLLTGSFDVIHVEHLRGAVHGQYALALRNGESATEVRPPIIWDSVDCLSRLLEHASHAAPSFQTRLWTRIDRERTRRFEARATGMFDHLVTTSDQDLRELLRLRLQAGSKNRDSFPFAGLRDAALPRNSCSASVVLNGVDLNHFRPPDEPREERTVLMSGRMSYHANQAAALHLVSNIMPLVWESRPDVKLRIVGATPPREIRRLATREGATGDHGGVEVEGSVIDMAPHLARATVAVAPLVYSVGIQNKVLEAMACGTPVVATSTVTTGIHARNGVDWLVADEPGRFARHILDLLNNPVLREEIGNAGRRYVTRNHSWAQSTSQLVDIYRLALLAARGDGKMSGTVGKYEALETVER